MKPVGLGGRMSVLTLRAKLTVLLVAMVLLACAAVGVITNIVVHNFLTSRLDHDLALAGSRYAISLEHNDQDADNQPETATVGQSVGTLGARLLNGHLTAVGVVSGSPAPIAVTAADRARIVDLARSGITHATVQFAGLGSYRVQLATGTDGDVLVTGLPENSVEDVLEVLQWTEVIVFLVVAVVIGVIGGFAVRRSLQPLKRVTATALRVSDLPLATGEVTLTERVPGQDHRTEVGSVAAAVNHMLTQVETALTQRQDSEDRLRQFIADASHELRTPLAIVRSHAELIELESADYSPSAQASLRSIDAGARRMSGLVDDLLLLARLDSGLPLDDADVDLTRLVLETLADARVVGPDHHWSLDLPEEPVIVRGDTERLHQVLTNLLTNARVHTPPGTAVSVSVSSRNPHARLDVVDNGPGIAPDLLPRVQERFTAGAGHHTRRAGSSGLGLAIVAGVVEAHEGRLEIASEPGRTCISIVIPLAPQPAEAAQITGTPPPGLPKDQYRLLTWRS